MAMYRLTINCKMLFILGLMLILDAQASSNDQSILFPHEDYTYQNNINNIGPLSYFRPNSDRDANYIGVNNLTWKLHRNIYKDDFCIDLETPNYGPRNRTPSGCRRRVLEQLMPNFSKIESELDQSGEIEYQRLVDDIYFRQINGFAGDQYIIVREERWNYLKPITFGSYWLVLNAASMLLFISVGIYTRVRKTTKRPETENSSKGAEEIGCTECLRFDFSTIKVATKYFSKKNKIGQSAIGVVYMGTLPNGQQIAVRKLNHSSSQWLLDYFKNEVQVASKFLHLNLIKIIGSCSKGEDRFLIYEFIPMSLGGLLFDRLKIKDICLNWEKRYKIIKGIASALLYLHEGSGLAVANGDIRASKVLLDQNLNPKILAFGTTKFVGDSLSDQLSTNFVGILEYLDPEYFKNGVISLMSDVYSFGVLLLEIISGQESECFRRDHAESLISYASRSWSQGIALNLVDPRLSYGNMESQIINRCIHVALLCVRAGADSRPTMSSVFLMLNSNNYSLSMPIILSESENSEQVIESNNSEAYSDSESLDIDSSDSFVSALELPLSPTSEAESSFHVNKGFVNLCYGILDRLRYLNFREIGSICRKIVANAYGKDYEQMQQAV